MVDATLQYLGITHEYEPPLKIDRMTIHPDFGLGHGIYLEYWGLKSPGYLKHKKLKQNRFKKSRFHLINIENEDLRNLLYVLTRNLKGFKKQFPQFQNTLAVLNK